MDEGKKRTHRLRNWENMNKTATLLGIFETKLIRYWLETYHFLCSVEVAFFIILLEHPEHRFGASHKNEVIDCNYIVDSRPEYKRTPYPQQNVE